MERFWVFLQPKLATSVQWGFGTLSSAAVGKLYVTPRPGDPVRAAGVLLSLTDSLGHLAGIHRCYQLWRTANPQFYSFPCSAEIHQHLPADSASPWFLNGLENAVHFHPVLCVSGGPHGPSHLGCGTILSPSQHSWGRSRILNSRYKNLRKGACGGASPTLSSRWACCLELCQTVFCEDCLMQPFPSLPAPEEVPRLAECLLQTGCISSLLSFPKTSTWLEKLDLSPTA